MIEMFDVLMNENEFGMFLQDEKKVVDLLYTIDKEEKEGDEK